MKLFSQLRFKDRFSKQLLLTFVLLGLLMFGSAIMELVQNKKAILTLTRSHSYALLETLLASSDNALLANEYIEDSYRERLFSNAHLIENLISSHKSLNTNELDALKNTGINNLILLSSKGHVLYGKSPYSLGDAKSEITKSTLAPLLSGRQDTLVIGVRKAHQAKTAWLYSAALRLADGRILVITINADQLIRFRWKIGFGVLLKRIAQSNQLLYIALQDSNTILAATGKVKLMPVFTDTTHRFNLEFSSRIIETDSSLIFESTHPFIYQGRRVGIFRVGLAMDEVEALTASLYRRLWIISAILAIFAIIILRLIFLREHFQKLQKQYDVVEGYSDLIIANASDAIIVSDNKKVTIINKAAIKLFSINSSDFLGHPLEKLARQIHCSGLIESQEGVFHLDCPINEGVRYLLVSKSRVQKADTTLSIFVLRDLTHEKALQEQIQRKERLSAMGELASGVAHEIRNPLNTIGTIVQQLDKDFEPNNDSAEYHTLARLVYKEVRRINETIQDFLKFSRPEALKPESFIFEEWMKEIVQHHQHMLNDQRIELRVHQSTIGSVLWDPHQMQQVMMNLILNATQAIGENGTIKVSAISRADEKIEILVADNGPGMSATTLKKIFDLYFTTKANGTGVGMAVVQRIIYEHGGLIHVTSTPGVGTEIHIVLPRKMEINEE